MNDHVYRVIEVVGSSDQSSDDAIRNALERAGKTVRGIRWFEVVETRGHVADDHGPPGTADDRFRVMEHLRHRHAHVAPGR